MLLIDFHLLERGLLDFVVDCALSIVVVSHGVEEVFPVFFFDKVEVDDSSGYGFDFSLDVHFGQLVHVVLVV